MSALKLRKTICINLIVSILVCRFSRVKKIIKFYYALKSGIMLLQATENMFRGALVSCALMWSIALDFRDGI